MARHFTAEDRIKLLKAYADSSLTVRKYATENGVGYSTFQRWAFDHGISLKKTAKLEGLDSFKAGRNQQFSATPVPFKDITADILLTPKAERVIPESLPTELAASSLLASAPALLKADHPPRTANGQLDVFLPKGIKMTFHQVSLTHSIALIKALV